MIDEVNNLINLAKKNNDSKLILSSKGLTSFPSEILELENLMELDLSNNQLTFLPPGISRLENLTKLDIRNNHLALLPREIIDLQLDINWEPVLARGIFVGGNPFGYPPIEIVRNGRNAIIDYFNSSHGKFEELNEVKVLLVGEGGVGKTSLVNRLTDGSYNEEELQTQGIHIKNWILKERDKDIRVKLWDFGGQEIMHATHQFFLSKRSLYILVLDSRKDDKAEYWLKNIQSFGGDSPVLIVINKIDENASFDLNRTFLKEKYHSIKGFSKVSCATNEGIENFSEKLRQELAHIEHMQIQWPISWFNVKTELEDMEREVISYKEYRMICSKYDIKEQSIQNTLIDFLNDLGVVIHFKDIHLFSTHILEPKWITGAVYKIINSKELANKNGVLEHGRLGNILEKKDKTDFNYSPEKYTFIINLMKKFELCYEIDEKSILIPDLLNVQEPPFNFDYNTALRFVIQYDFLPRSVMPRFIVKMHKDIKNNLYWRTGVILKDAQLNSTAVIKSDNEAKRIYIYVNGKQKRDYFSVILFNLRQINKSFKRLDIIEKVPMPAEPEVTVSYNHLIKLNKMGIHKYIPDGSDFEYDVQDLLGTINNNLDEERGQSVLNNKKITMELLLEKCVQ